MSLDGLSTGFLTVKKFIDCLVGQLSDVLKLLHQILLQCEDVREILHQPELCLLQKQIVTNFFYFTLFFLLLSN